MESRKKSNWQCLLALILIAASCTIIEDGDLTSFDDFNKLKITGFDIEMDNASSKANLNYDSVQNFIDPNTQAKIVRKLEYSVPALGNKKLKFKSGTTTATKIYIYYLENRKPYTVGVVSQDSVVELYRFRYSSSGQLSRIVTIINPSNDNAGPTIVTADEFTYGTQGKFQEITKVVRNTSTTYDLEYNPRDEGNLLFTVKTGGAQILTEGAGNNGSGGCGDDENRGICVGYQRSGQGQSSSPSIIISALQLGSALKQLVLLDQRASGNNSGREFDTYYFHPLMLLKGQVDSGSHLLVFYSIDWWQLGASVSVNPSTNQTVKFEYSYGQ